MQEKSKEELLEDLKVIDQYDQSQELDGGMGSWTYGMGPVATGTGTLDESFDINFDVNDNLYQPSFDFEDEKLRNKYPALQDAWEHYQNVKQMCETRESEENAS